MNIITDVPQPFLDGFRRIAAFTPKETKLVLQGVKKTGIRDTTKYILASLAFIKDMALRDNTANTIFSIGHLRNTFKSKINQLPDEILAKTMDKWSDDEKKGVDTKAYKNTLIQLFEGGIGLEQNFKVSALLHSHGAVLKKVQVVTDVRPVFQENLEKFSGIIFHNLLFTVKENGVDKTIRIAIDKPEIRDIQKALERALEKERVLRKSSKNFPLFVHYDEQK